MNRKGAKDAKRMLNCRGAEDAKRMMNRQGAKDAKQKDCIFLIRICRLAVLNPWRSWRLGGETFNQSNVRSAMNLFLFIRVHLRSFAFICGRTSSWNCIVLSSWRPWRLGGKSFLKPYDQQGYDRPI